MSFSTNPCVVLKQVANSVLTVGIVLNIARYKQNVKHHISDSRAANLQQAKKS